jgi:hypothetical protein
MTGKQDRLVVSQSEVLRGQDSTSRRLNLTTAHLVKLALSLLYEESPRWDPLDHMMISSLLKLF